MNRLLTHIHFILCFLLFAVSCVSHKTLAQKTKNKRIEQPASMRGVPEYILERTGYILSFNRLHNNPNYVAWELTAEETEGRVSRAKEFEADPDLPQTQRVLPSDYKGSGYDRGHMAPAGDMKWSSRAMVESFYMSNVCPQNRTLNGGAWQTLEEACRRWAKKEGAVYIVCGPVYLQERKNRKTIGRETSVTIPDGFFKVVLSLRLGHEKAIGFYYENHEGSQPMKATVRSVDEIEKLTGIDFYVNLDRKLERRLEASCSLKDWK